MFRNLSVFVLASLSLTSVAHAATCRTETVCAQKTVCRVVCAAAGGAIGGAIGGGVGAGAGVGAGSQICSELCELVPDCQTRYVCDQYVAPGESFFLLPSNEEEK